MDSYNYELKHENEMEIDAATIVIAALAILCFAIPIGYDQMKKKSDKDDVE